MITYLIGAIAALLGGFLWQKSKRESAEALLTNADTKKEVQDLDAQKAKNNASLQLEEERRALEKEKSDEEKARDVVNDELLDFLNKSRK